MRVASCVSIIVAVYSFTVLRSSSDVDSVRSTDHEIPRNMFNFPHQEGLEFRTMLKPFLIDTPTCTHRTTGCFDDRLLTMMTDTGFYVPWRVGHNFRSAKLLEKPSGTLWWMSTLVSDERSYRNKLTLYILQIKPHLIIIWEVSQEKSQKTVIWSGCASLRQSLLSALTYIKITIIQLHFCQILSRSLIL